MQVMTPHSFGLQAVPDKPGLFIKKVRITFNNLDYSRAEIAVAARPQPMKL
jgi:hypothetical protein